MMGCPFFGAFFIVASCKSCMALVTPVVRFFERDCMSISRPPAWGEFIKTFNSIAHHKHRYEVFRDFVTMSAITLHNAVRMDEKLEAEYLQIIRRYDKSEVEKICQLFALLVSLLNEEPSDVLGQLFMELDFGSTHIGQFFTPPEVSELIAGLTYGDGLKTLDKPFISVSEPACGAGGMVLAMVKIMRSHGHNPHEQLFVQAQDVDRVAALMCYLQLSLWHIPAQVIVGNTLTLEVREVFLTPAYLLGGWDIRLRSREMEEATKRLISDDGNFKVNTESMTVPAMIYKSESMQILGDGASRTHTQSAFDF